MQDPREKAIFRYFNGDRWVWGDPLALSRRLDTSLGDPDAVFADVGDPDPKVWRPAVECLIANVRDVFAIAPIDPETGAGGTEEHCRAALQALWEFLAKKKPTNATMPSSSASITSTPTPSPTKSLSA